ALGKRKNVRSSSAPSRKLVTTQIAARGSAYVVSLPRVPGAPNRGPWVSLRRVRRVAAQSAWRAARRAAGDRADRGPWGSLWRWPEGGLGIGRAQEPLSTWLGY